MQLAFAREYTVDRHGKAAAIRAGYAEANAAKQAYQLLNTQKVKAEIDRIFSEHYERNKMSIDECISILTDIARTEPSDLYNPDGTLKKIHDIPKFARHAIDSIKFKTKFVYDELLDDTVPFVYPTEIKVTSKQSAIEKILRHLGGFEKDNQQQRPDPIVLNINPLNQDTTIDISHNEVGPDQIGPGIDDSQPIDNEEDSLY